VRIHLKILPPGVEHTQETDLGAEVLGISGDLGQRVSTGLE
jgi:hypothetical protein